MLVRLISLVVLRDEKFTTMSRKRQLTEDALRLLLGTTVGSVVSEEGENADDAVAKGRAERQRDLGAGRGEWQPAPEAGPSYHLQDPHSSPL